MAAESVAVRVNLRREQADRLRQRARMSKVSVSTLVQQAVDTYLDEGEESDALLGLIGMFDSGLTDMAVNHDKYLVEAYEDLHLPCPPKSS